MTARKEASVRSHAGDHGATSIQNREQQTSLTREHRPSRAEAASPDRQQRLSSTLSSSASEWSSNRSNPLSTTPIQVDKRDGHPSDSSVERGVRPDISMATYQRENKRDIPSPFAIHAARKRSESTQQEEVHVTSTSEGKPALLTVPPSSPLITPPKDDSFRFRQQLGQHAWMTRHIRIHNGGPAEVTETDNP